MLASIIGISVMGETSDLIEGRGDGSSPSEAHFGRWESIGTDRNISDSSSFNN